MLFDFNLFQPLCKAFNFSKRGKEAFPRNTYRRWHELRVLIFIRFGNKPHFFYQRKMDAEFFVSHRQRSVCFGM